LTSGELLDDRLHWVKHKGQALFVLDFSHCSAKQMLLLLDMIRASVAQHPPGSVLVLADFAGAQIDKQVATRVKEVLVLDRPYVKRAAWVGTESLPKVFYEHFKSFSQRDLPTFKTREEAMDWLVSSESE
jgi:SpoIIAA-like